MGARGIDFFFSKKSWAFLNARTCCAWLAKMPAKAKQFAFAPNLLCIKQSLFWGVFCSKSLVGAEGIEPPAYCV